MCECARELVQASARSRTRSLIEVDSANLVAAASRSSGVAAAKSAERSKAGILLRAHGKGSVVRRSGWPPRDFACAHDYLKYQVVVQILVVISVL